MWARKDAWLPSDSNRESNEGQGRRESAYGRPGGAVPDHLAGKTKYFRGGRRRALLLAGKGSPGTRGSARILLVTMHAGEP